MAQEVEAQPGQGGSEIQVRTKPAYPIEPWHEDYPVALDLPVPNPAPVYVRSRKQALERVVANLQGNTRREVWLMATEFFRRAPEDAVESLVALMDRSLGQPLLIDVVRNAIEAMGRMERVELEPALRRALEHPDGGVQQAAFAALATSGSPDSLRWCATQFLVGMDGRARAGWLRAVRMRLPDELVDLVGPIVKPDCPPIVRDMVLKEAMLMPPKAASQILAPLWELAAGDLKATLAGMRHAAEDGSGTAWLHGALTSDDLSSALRALRAVKGRELGMLREPVMKLSTSPRPEVRLAVAEALVGVEGEDVTRVFEQFAGEDELVETKSIALRELTQRGRPEAVAAMLEALATATGSRQQLVLRMLGQCGDPRCVDVYLERYRKAPPEEGRAFLVAIALSRAPNAPRALFDVYLESPRAVSKPDGGGGVLDTVSYVPILLPNLRGGEAQLLTFWSEIPKADYQRRAGYLNALVGVAVDREDRELANQVATLLREVLYDPKELPQLRVQALNALTRSWLDMDDVRRLTRLQDAGGKDESQAMRALVKDFLFEYF